MIIGERGTTGHWAVCCWGVNRTVPSSCSEKQRSFDLCQPEGMSALHPSFNQRLWSAPRLCVPTLCACMDSVHPEHTETKPWSQGPAQQPFGCTMGSSCQGSPHGAEEPAIVTPVLKAQEDPRSVTPCPTGPNSAIADLYLLAHVRPHVVVCSEHVTDHAQRVMSLTCSKWECGLRVLGHP